MAPFRASLGLCALLIANISPAHEIRPAYLQIDEIAPDRFDVLWKQPKRGELMVYLEPTASNGLFDEPPDQLQVTDSFAMRRWQGRKIARESFDQATLRIKGLEQTLTDTLVNISFANGQHIQTLLKPDAPSITIRLTGTGRPAVFAYLALGIKHTLTGFDHLAFLLGLLLLVRIRLLLGTISAFTLAHSLTLCAAALGYVRFNALLIESLVALSIVFIAVELTRFWRGHKGITSEHPWLIALAFGLLHGLAFVGTLADVGLPEQRIPTALLLFNCGVEIGQLCFVGVMLLLAALQRHVAGNFVDYGRWPVAYALGTIAAYWTIERVGTLIR